MLVKEMNFGKDNLYTFDFDEIKNTLKEVSQYLQQQYNFILPQAINQVHQIEDVNELIKKFVIISTGEPIFKKLNGADEVQRVLDEIKACAENMGQAIDEIADQYKQQIQDSQLVEMVDMLARQIQKFRKRLYFQIERFTIESAGTVDEIHHELYRFLAGILKPNLIERVIPVIYKGMKDGNSAIYDVILNNIDKFLAALGGQTLNIEVGQKVDYDFCMPLESEDNKTTDYKLKEVIKEIRQLPYIFDREHPIVEGQVIVWRFENVQ